MCCRLRMRLGSGQKRGSLEATLGSSIWNNTVLIMTYLFTDSFHCGHIFWCFNIHSLPPSFFFLLMGRIGSQAFQMSPQIGCHKGYMSALIALVCILTSIHCLHLPPPPPLPPQAQDRELNLQVQSLNCPQSPNLVQP